MADYKINKINYTGVCLLHDLNSAIKITDLSGDYRVFLDPFHCDDISFQFTRLSHHPV